MPNPTELTVLGFDFGLKRIGVAVGQTLTQSATPLATLPADNGTPDWQTIKKLIQEWQANSLVVGVPVSLGNDALSVTEAAQQFAIELEQRFALPVHTADERLTTKAAREQLYNEGGYKKLQSSEIDSVAAQLILEGWLRTR